MGQDNPKPGLLRRIFGEPLSESTAKQWPELEKSWGGRQAEMPNESQGVNNLRPMNFLEKAYFGPTVNAATYPWGSVALNREGIEKNKVNLDSLLVHELTHVGQGQKQGIFKTMFSGGSKDMPDYEQEAYDAENNRYKKVRTTDIALPSPIRNTYPNKVETPGNKELQAAEIQGVRENPFKKDNVILRKYYDSRGWK